MNSNSSPSLHDQILAAYQNLQKGKPQQALDQLTEIRKTCQENSDVEHLLALSHKSLGDIEASKSKFLASLRINSGQPEVHNNFANLLKSVGSYKEAEGHYCAALKLHPGFLQAQKNLAICKQAQCEFDKARYEFSKAVELSPTDVSALTGLADCLRAMGDLESAEKAYRRALEVNPKRVNAWHNLGLNLHLQGEAVEALKCYEKAYSLAPNSLEVVQSYALCSHENGNTPHALKVFERALQHDPNHIELHERYNELLWESGLIERFCDSYDQAINRVGESSELVYSYSSSLFSAGESQRAGRVLQKSKISVENDPRLLSIKGKIEAELGDYETASRSLGRSLEQEFSNDVAHQLVKIDIIRARYQSAQVLLDEVFTRVPMCQLTWALQSLVWRLMNDERYYWLNNYREFVKVYELEVPSSFGSLSEFLSQISYALEELHTAEHAPLLQTLRNGTQTAPRLLHNSNPIIKMLKDAVHKNVREYIASLPDDKSHPFLARKGADFEFSGSWSVKLRPEGFHINHIHTEGWISSSCYISIPESMHSQAASSEENQGCIKFGESPLSLGEREVVEMIVTPKPGLVVLFPSYFWHGTFPFSGADSDCRLTAPFDVQPL